MDSPSLTILARYKFRTTFHDDSVEHTTHTSDLRSRQRRVEVKTKWTREKELGSGAFGTVWKERQELTKELRAVKIIPRRLVNTREVEALAALQDHPDLFVLFLGWFEDRDSIYLAMEYIEHGDLGQYIKADPARAKEGAQVIATQILEGLVVLHARGICHRDMKPQNILIASIEPIWIKISDFGISKRAVGTYLRTSCGTMAYTSPEQHGLLPRHMRTRNRYSTAVDIWALGVVIHEILTSEIPFLDTYQDMDTDMSFSLTMDDMGPQLDAQLLSSYCNGFDPFPIACLQESGVGEEGIDFVKGLMAVNPADRATAKDALNCLLSIPVLCPAPASTIGPALLVCQLLGLSIPLSPEQASMLAAEDQVVLNRIVSSAKHEMSSGGSNTTEGITEFVVFLTKYIKQCQPDAIALLRLSLQVVARPSYLALMNMLYDHVANTAPDLCRGVLTSASNMAVALYNKGMYDEALPCYRRLLVAREKALGTDHPDTLATVHAMGVMYHVQGKYDEALEWRGRALAGREKALGKDHPDTLTSVHEMGVTYYQQGKYDDALEWYGRAFAGREKALGMDHPDTLTTVHAMGLTYYQQGKYDDALEWYGRAFAGREKALGKDHHDTLTTVDAIGVTYHQQGKYDETLEWRGRAFAGREKALGMDHPDTLTTVHAMGLMYYQQGKYDDALEWYGRAFAGREKALGTDHPDTLTTVHEMGVTYHQQGKYDEALEWYGRALAGREKALGKDHHDTLTTVDAIGVTYHQQGKYDETLEWRGRAFAGREKALGMDHPDTLTTVHAMGLMYYQQGKYDDALEWYGRAFAGREKALGTDHPDTLTTVHEMGVTYHQQGKYDEALKMDWRVLAGREKALGKDHPDTLTTVHGIGVTYHVQGKYDKALEWRDRALAGREKALGKDHPDTLTTVHEMGITYHEQKKYDDAREWYGRALAGREKVLGKDHPNTKLTAAAIARLHSTGLGKK